MWKNHNNLSHQKQRSQSRGHQNKISSPDAQKVLQLYTIYLFSSANSTSNNKQKSACGYHVGVNDRYKSSR